MDHVIVSEISYTDPDIVSENQLHISREFLKISNIDHVIVSEISYTDPNIVSENQLN